MSTGNSQPQTDIRPDIWQIEAEAREWFMLQGERTLSDSEQVAFAHWMEQPQHRSAYQQLQQIDQTLAALAASEEGARLRQPSGLSALMETLRSYFDVSPLNRLAFACTLMLALGIAYLAPWQGEPAAQAYASELAQVRNVVLEDGTRVTLGGDSALEAEFSEGSRRIKLLRGQAFFDVRKDPTRPFVISAQGAEVRVVGTRFDVRTGSKLNPAVKVTVEEGIVDVARKTAAKPDEAENKVRLTAGQQVKVDEKRISPVSKVDTTSVASWRQGKFSYRDAPLSEIVADANRYRKDRIIIGTRELESLRVTTAFTADQADTLVAMLEQSLPVRVFKEPDGRVVIWPGTVEH
ncbi:FecR domain-containing protein [Microbulbifer agarilyticus]|uniref:FecR family protein n=1 Tax=Microbulbifer agarilyticus TaxID=260552 RepID=UPI001C94CE89|nr:FecR domain-containing protein [Microbulbifer agarilyticus]MBY6211682.1 FecR domain-containing protein [Microbulbifer agarilyticus]